MGVPVTAVPSQCDRAGLSGTTLGLDFVHWLSSGFASLARGPNGAPKIAMNHAEGLSANLTTSSLVLLSGIFGAPVSTTHISSSAIIGIGLLKGAAEVHWTTVRDMVLAWIVTLPIAAALACLAYLLLIRTLAL